MSLIKSHSHLSFRIWLRISDLTTWLFNIREYDTNWVHICNLGQMARSFSLYAYKTGIIWEFLPRGPSLSASVEHSKSRTECEWMNGASWSFASGKTGYRSQGEGPRASWIWRYKEAPWYKSQTHKQDVGALCSNRPVSLSQQPAFQGAVTPASDFFPVVCKNNGTQRPELGLLFLATAWAAQPITESFGCPWSVEPWVGWLSICYQALNAY